jgi:hypothetical protein
MVERWVSYGGKGPVAVTRWAGGSLLKKVEGKGGPLQRDQGRQETGYIQYSTF